MTKPKIRVIATWSSPLPPEGWSGVTHHLYATLQPYAWWWRGRIQQYTESRDEADMRYATRLKGDPDPLTPEQQRLKDLAGPYKPQLGPVLKLPRHYGDR